MCSHMHMKSFLFTDLSTSVPGSRDLTFGRENSITTLSKSCLFLHVPYTLNFSIMLLSISL